MRKFRGFPPKTARLVGIPVEVFTDLLPLIDDPAELKITLFCLWALQQKDGDFRYLRRRDFSGETAAMHGLDADSLDTALKRAIERETLLCADVKVGGETETLYFANSNAGRTAVRQINAGKWKPGDSNNPVEILPERPSVYKLYEDNIGALTPLISDDLKDLDSEFGSEWLEEAIKISVEAEKRNLRYVRAVLERWKKEGRRREVHTGSYEEDGKRYISGEYADFIEH